MKKILILCLIAFNLNAVGNGPDTELLQAVKDGKFDVAKQLLENGANPQVMDSYKSLIDIALQRGSLSSLSFSKDLMDKGLSPELVDDQGRTALFYAVETFHKYYEGTPHLNIFKGKANFNAQDNEGNTPLHYLGIVYKEEETRIKNMYSRAERKKLIERLLKSAINTIKGLIANGADPSIQNNDGKTPAKYWGTFHPLTKHLKGAMKK